MSLAGVILKNALSSYAYGGDEDKRIAMLQDLAPLIERVIPVEFAFDRIPGKDL